MPNPGFGRTEPPRRALREQRLFQRRPPGPKRSEKPAGGKGREGRDGEGRGGDGTGRDGKESERAYRPLSDRPKIRARRKKARERASRTTQPARLPENGNKAGYSVLNSQKQMGPYGRVFEESACRDRRGRWKSVGTNNTKRAAFGRPERRRRRAPLGRSGRNDGCGGLPAAVTGHPRATLAAFAGCRELGAKPRSGGPDESRGKSPGTRCSPHPSATPAARRRFRRAGVDPARIAI